MLMMQARLRLAVVFACETCPARRPKSRESADQTAKQLATVLASGKGLSGWLTQPITSLLNVSLSYHGDLLGETLHLLQTQS